MQGVQGATRGWIWNTCGQMCLLPAVPTAGEDGFPGISPSCRLHEAKGGQESAGANSTRSATIGKRLSVGDLRVCSPTCSLILFVFRNAHVKERLYSRCSTIRYILYGSIRSGAGVHETSCSTARCNVWYVPTATVGIICNSENSNPPINAASVTSTSGSLP